MKNRHGFAIPLSALRSKQSCGIGEFTDLLPMIDWCRKVSFDIIQLLPINDTGPDPSPYNALSGSALHPIYIGLSHLKNSDYPDLKELLHKLQEFNNTQRVAYHKVLKLKELFLERYYELEGATICKNRSFQEFCKKQDHLKPYALFKVLKTNMEGRSWQDWPDDIKNCTHHHYKDLLHKHEEEVNYQLFIQYLCYDQLKRVKTYATSKNVQLKGDVPILISPDSADVWYHKEIFDLNFAAGAPPDQFTPDGQYWGFPIYKWAVLAAQDYSWWVTRLRFAENFFHLDRVDHIIGFFHIWATPRGKSIKEGGFIPNKEWEALAQGRELLTMMLNACSMLPIGEDLGITPSGMPEVMEELGIPGTKVMRWEFDKKTKEYFLPSEYPPVSMTCVSTHDSETLAQWWELEPQESKLFAVLLDTPFQTTLSKENRKKILHAAHHSGSQFHINLLGEYLALFDELVWEKLDDERINRPGKVLKENWTYRLRPLIEELYAHEELAEAIDHIVTTF